MTLSYAVTSYKCQGDTLDKVIIDFEHQPGEIKSVPCGSFYVALTRVKEGKNVYLKSFKESYITVNKKVEEKIEAMRRYKPYTFKKNYVSDKIFEDESDEVKLGYFNIFGFMSSNHAEYLDSDLNLLCLDFLVVSETWLTSDVCNADVINKLKDWRVLKRLDATDNKKHMGLLLLTPKAKSNSYKILYSLDYIEGYSSSNGQLLYQGLIVDIKSLYRRASFLYIRRTPNTREVNEIKKALQSCDIIIGDLNLNPKIIEQKQKLKTICGTTKFMALEEITTLHDSQLEHVIVEKDLRNKCYATAYFNFGSDHKSIGFRISSFANSFTSGFKQKINFDSDHHLKTKVDASRKKENIETIKEKEERNNSNNDGGHPNRFKNSSLKILKFPNPPQRNLCFSNAITSALLNAPVIKSMISENTDHLNLHLNKKMITEIIRLTSIPNLTIVSTENLRLIVSTICEESGQIRQNFSDTFQHDAGEFLISIFEHLFIDSFDSYKIEEDIFGGLYQETIACTCGYSKELPIQKLSGILVIQIKGQSIQSCLLEFLGEEEIKLDCTECGNNLATKKTELVNEPSTLIIQLKRYTYDIDKRKCIKIHDNISCPKSLVMPSGISYTLSSIVNHIGDQPTEGHYNIVIYDKIDDCFVLLDDKNISVSDEMSPDINELCYVLIFTKDV